MSDISLEFVDLHTNPESSPILYKVADSPCYGAQRELLFKK